MFLFRYGGVGGGKKLDKSTWTPLDQLMVIECRDGGSADMGGVYQIENCVKVFHACWQRLRTKLKQSPNPKHSMLRYVVDANELQVRRRMCSRKASIITRFDGPKHYPTQEKTTETALPPAACTRSHEATLPSTPVQLNTDDEAEQLKAGYGEASKPKASKKSKKRSSGASQDKKKAKNQARRRRKLEEGGKGK
jgi:hypothetical protein